MLIVLAHQVVFTTQYRFCMMDSFVNRYFYIGTISDCSTTETIIINMRMI